MLEKAQIDWAGECERQGRTRCCPRSAWSTARSAHPAPHFPAHPDRSLSREHRHHTVFPSRVHTICPAQLQGTTLESSCQMRGNAEEMLFTRGVRAGKWRRCEPDPIGVLSESGGRAQSTRSCRGLWHTLQVLQLAHHRSIYAPLDQQLRLG